MGEVTADEYVVGFATLEAWDEFGRQDCPGLRRLIAELRNDPTPNGKNRRQIVGGVLIMEMDDDGTVYKIAYRYELGEAVVITATSVSSIPPWQ